MSKESKKGGITKGSAIERRSTITDVARLAKVSVQSVSNVINGKPSVSPDIKKRVAAAIRDLGYVQNFAAKSLRARHGHTLALLVEDDSHLALRDITHAQLLSGMVERARYRDYAVVVAVTAPADTERHIATFIQERGVSGVLLSLQGIEGERVTLLKQVAKSRLPIVIHEQRLAVHGVCGICADVEGGARDAFQHLRSLGHQRFAFLGGSTLWPAVERRIATYIACAQEESCELRVWRSPGWTLDAARATIRPVLASFAPTAVLAANDVLAVGILQSAEDLGLRVPSDLSIVGFDDFEFSSFVRPSLTTVKIDATQMGEWAAEILINAAEGGEVSTDLVLPTNLVIRSSTGPAPTLRAQ